MATDTRALLDRLIGALENFHQVAMSSADPQAPSLIEATDAVANAFVMYDDAMFTTYGAELPLDLFDPDEFWDGDSEDDLDDEDEDSNEDDLEDLFDEDDDLDEDDFDDEDLFEEDDED